MDSLKGHELGISVQDPQTHQWGPAKYGDPRLARAEADLADIARPWTVSKIIAALKTERAEWPHIVSTGQEQTGEETEEMTRRFRRELDRCEELARLLGASGDPRAAVALGEAFDTWYPDQAVVIDAFFDYFVRDMYYGLPANDKLRRVESFNKLSLSIPAATRWWKDNKARLMKEAAALGRS